MKFTWKPNYQTTYHRDGTASYWSVYLQQWLRAEIDTISDRELATWNEAQRLELFRKLIRLVSR